MTADELAVKLDAKYVATIWRLWRAGYKDRWVADVAGDKHSTCDGATIAEALQKLLDYRPLPVVPKRPQLLTQAAFWVERATGGRWCIKVGGAHIGCAFKTRKEACAHVQVAVQRSIESCEQWSRDFGAIVAGGVEGETFRWAE